MWMEVVVGSSPYQRVFIRGLFPLYIIMLWFISIFTSDEILQKSEKDMTEAELKQVEVDRAYFHSHRDKNKDGMMDKVNSFKWF